MASVSQCRKCALHFSLDLARHMVYVTGELVRFRENLQYGQQPYMERAKDCRQAAEAAPPAVKCCQPASRQAASCSFAAVQQRHFRLHTGMPGRSSHKGQRRCQSMRPFSVRAITSSFVLRACANHVSLRPSSMMHQVHPMCVYILFIQDTPSTATAKEHYK